MSKLILLRHGQSQWNRDNLFTGWVDVPLTMQGIDEALQAGEKFATAKIDCIFTSTLLRAQQTALLAMSQNNSPKVPIRSNDNAWHKIYSDSAEANSIPIIAHSDLNERYYGELQGMNKDTAREKFGAEQVHIWRRSYNTPPPGGESLQNTVKRAWSFFENNILPQLANGKNCLVAAHGNSLRAIIMQIEQMSPDEILKFEIATGQPIFYEFNAQEDSFTKAES